MKQFILFLGFLFPYLLMAQSSLLRVADIEALPTKPALARLSYGTDPNQFGELRLPDGEGLHPVVVILHGGCWLSAYDLTLMDPMATALTQAGYATWNLEYRRVGNPGGGWPGTFRDIIDGVNYLRELARTYPLDLSRVVVVGHSAGGHLALWLGVSRKLSSNSPIANADALPLSGILSLAGIVDPATYLDREGNSCGASVDDLLGGLPEDHPARYREASPLAQVPLGIPHILLTGERDPIVPVGHVAIFAEAATAAGDKSRSVTVSGAGHFEVIAPGSVAWPQILSSIHDLMTRE